MKTVYVLGAGFSRSAEFPLQAEILDRVRDFKVDLMQAPRHAMDVFRPAQDRLSQFLAEVFPPGETPPLEDVFTLLDQTINEKQHCAGFHLTELERILDGLKRAILFVFHDAGEKIPSKASQFYRTFCAWLIDQRLQGQHEISVVSLNWDCLLEDTIYWCLRETGWIGKADVDYCCYTIPLGDSSPHTTSILQKAKGLMNLKVLKLHGSANWLICPNCNRLYTGLGGEEEVWSQYVLQQSCPECRRLPQGIGQSHEPQLPELEPFFITPTFVKVFDNTHIQTIWHNAYIEFTEADHVVFIGYSLPDADYHLRTLFRRAIRPDTRITVVLTSNAEPKKNTPKWLHHFYSAVRYRRFFGSERVSLDMGGAAGYCNTVTGGVDLEDQLESLRARLN